MPNSPERSQIHIDVALTDISIAYQQDASNFICERIFPSIPVSKQSNKYYVYDKGDALRVHTQIRGAGAESAGAGYDITKDNYYCDPFALHTEVNDQDRANTDDPLSLDTDGTEFVTNNILMKKELDFFTKFFTTGVWEKDYTGVASGPTGDQVLRWDLAGSSPVADVTRIASYIVSQTGVRKKEMTLTCEPGVWDVLKNHEEILDRIKYTEKGIVTEDLVAQVFGIKEVIEATAVYNAAVKGQTDDIKHMAPAGTALLSYAPSRPGLKKPSAGYTFNWTGYNKGSATAVYKWYIQERRADRIEAETAYDQKIVATDCAAFLTSLVTP